MLYSVVKVLRGDGGSMGRAIGWLLFWVGLIVLCSGAYLSYERTVVVFGKQDIVALYVWRGDVHVDTGPEYLTNDEDDDVVVHMSTGASAAVYMSSVGSHVEYCSTRCLGVVLCERLVFYTPGGAGVLEYEIWPSED
jgi:hypothetical protein